MNQRIFSQCDHNEDGQVQGPVTPSSSLGRVKKHTQSSPGHQNVIWLTFAVVLILKRGPEHVITITAPG